MQHESDGILLSATDLANHLACRHLSELDHLVASGRLDKPSWQDPNLDVLRERGLRHERAYVEHLRGQGLHVVDLTDAPRDPAVTLTEAALSAGADVVVQAALRQGRWGGFADILRRVEEPSDLGAWSYEVADTKLAQDTRGGTVLQLCLYADLVGAIQGHAARRLHVVKPGDGFPTESFRFDEHAAYYRWVRQRLETFMERREAVVAAAATDAVAPTGATVPGLDHYPEPIEHCDICRWWSRCDRRRHDDDHLSLVAGLGRLHAKELRRQGTDTLEGFATSTEFLREPPLHGQRETYDHYHEQARIQLAGRRSGQPEHELLPVVPERGFTRLPEPSPGDVYLDFEGDPFVEGGGLEYLLGYALHGEGDALEYVALWAEDAAAERRAFESFIDFVMARIEEHQDLHVYHYAPYEPSALKRLASRHATREAEVDELLRAHRFVDLFGVVRQGLRASVESYSLKPLEEFTGFVREVELREEASPALRRVAHALELGVPDVITDEDRRAVEGYNRDDCLSLVTLQWWLEEQRAVLVARGEPVRRPPLVDGKPTDKAEERAADIQAVFERLVDGIPDDPHERTVEQGVRWRLAHMLEYFQREGRVAWWEYFARRDADAEERLKDRKILTGMRLVEDLGVPGGRNKLPVHRYGFPDQDASFDAGDEVFDLDSANEFAAKVGTVVAFDARQGLIDVKKTKDTIDVHPSAVHERGDVPKVPVAGALLEVGRSIAEHGLSAVEAKFPASRRLLLREPPNGRSGAVESSGERARRDTAPPSLITDGEDLLDAGCRLALALDGGVLGIQGPPGTGKTYNGARMILALARAGKRVGVTATSHKVVRNMLEKVVKAARAAGDDVRVVHKFSSRGRPPEPIVGIEDTKDNAAFASAVTAGAIGGGVAWTWAREGLEQQIDHLFIDEAGQMSLAHVLATSRAARNLVLLGDPIQLQQPQRGAHPEGADISALDYLLGEHKTMPGWLRLFLDETWRLPPAICDYTSEVYYESRLAPRAGRERQALTGETRFAGAGLGVVPVEHDGNASVANEEVDVVARIVDELTAGAVGWIDAEGKQRDLQADDILVVAPYNAQVAALSRRLPGVRVGTVDRFQGQERPVVIYSMASSSPEDAPRGLSFLYDVHRLNVATSRAQCVCILVASPALFEPECVTPEQIRWASALCRYRELAEVVTLK